jgi:hypothetical protein
MLMPYCINYQHGPRLRGLRAPRQNLCFEVQWRRVVGAASERFLSPTSQPTDSGEEALFVADRLAGPLESSPRRSCHDARERTPQCHHHGRELVGEPRGGHSAVQVVFLAAALLSLPRHSAGSVPFVPTVGSLVQLAAFRHRRDRPRYRRVLVQPGMRLASCRKGVAKGRQEQDERKTAPERSAQAAIPHPVS